MIIFNGKNSFTDFDLYIASREQSPAKRKTITETVPYMSGIWDFSYLDGEDEYEPVTIKYAFDVIADTKKELKAMRNKLVAWLHSKGENKLIDTDISENSYYKVYHAQASWSEVDLQGLLSVEFLCYPFLLTDKTETMTLSATAKSINVNNYCDRPIMPTISVASKNLFDISKITSNAYITNNGDGTLTLSKNEYFVDTNKRLYELCPQLKVGDICILTFQTTNEARKYVYLSEYGKVWVSGTSLTVTQEVLNSVLDVYGAQVDDAAYGQEIVLSNIQIELGETSTAYTPFVNATATIKYGITTHSLSAGEYKGILTLKQGENTFTAKGTGLLTVDYSEEVL